MKNVLVMDSPIGKLTLVEEDDKLICIDFGDSTVSELNLGDNRSKNVNYEENFFLGNVKNQLDEYFEGKRKTFDIVLDPKGTEFQRKVWDKLMNIPYGQTASYKDIAVKVGNDKASRAIGMANNKNPIPIIIPCHRVVGSSGKMVGYAGGLDIKESLLNLEKN